MVVINQLISRGPHLVQLNRLLHGHPHVPRPAADPGPGPKQRRRQRQAEVLPQLQVQARDHPGVCFVMGERRGESGFYDMF